MWTSESEQKAIEQFQKAVDVEPNYADAWAGLADAWTASAMNGNMRMSAAQGHRPKTLLTGPLRSIRTIRPLMYPCASSRIITISIGRKVRDFAAAELNSIRIIQRAHFAYAFMLARLERWDDMAAQMGEAMRVDPAQPWWPAGMRTGLPKPISTTRPRKCWIGLS